MKSLNELLRRMIYFFFGLFFDNGKTIPPIDKSLVRKILIFRYDVIGDMIVSLPSFNLIRKFFPTSELWILASKTNYIILQGNSDVDKVIVYTSSFWKKIKIFLMLKKENFDVIINYVFNKTTKAGLLANFIGPKAIKVNIGHQTRNEIYSKLFNLNVPLELLGDVYMPILLIKYISYIFGINVAEDFFREYSIKIPPKKYLYALQLRNNLDFDYILFFNISAGKKNRMLEIEQYIELLRMLSNNFPKLGILVSSHPKDESFIMKIHQEKLRNVVCLPSSASIWNTIAILSLCDFVFTPDTSIVHIANMMNKPSVYLIISKITDPKVWVPVSKSNRIIISHSEKFKDVSIERVYKELSSMILSVSNNFS
ncbi:MAG: glycosyltransferase family 9 protein [Candidatus Kapaibacteriales bacterium]